MRRVTVEQIREALALSSGRVARAARVLGIARNNLYKRLANSGISPDEFRGNSATGLGATADAHATRGAASGATGAAVEQTGPVPVLRTAIFHRGRREPRLVRVDSAADDQGRGEPKQLRLSRSVYLRPDQIRALDDACLDLPGVLREKLSPSKVLERFIDDCFGSWLGSKLGDVSAKSRRKKASE